ncbi:hypothetical protein [Luteimonas mephitis]|uniref:DUF7507 domain-containing protein n=1 Tax=Luteimonas mephitis TaxID=83615 RepID=UPI003A94CCBC
MRHQRDRDRHAAGVTPVTWIRRPPIPRPPRPRRSRWSNRRHADGRQRQRIADGDTIAYSFAVSNDGNVPLNGVVINDTKLSATPIACMPSTIPVGGIMACSR